MKQTTLNRIPNSRTFVFSGVQFVKRLEIGNEEIMCTITDTSAVVHIAEHTVVSVLTPIWPG